MSSTLDGFITQCWNKVSQSKDFIYIWQVTNLIEEFETRLGTKDILKQAEKNLLNEMIQDKPSLKLYKLELNDFILKLVQQNDMMKFLSERSGISRANLTSLMNNPSHSRIPLTPSKQHINSNVGVNIDTSTPIKSTTPNVLRNHPLESLKERQINQRDDQITLITKENNELRDSNHQHMAEIRHLQSSNATLKSYIESIERELKYANELNNSAPNKTNQNAIIKDLVSQCNERDKTIKVLENMCEQYQKEFTKLKENPVIDNMTRNVAEQNKLIDSLKQKLKLSENSDNLDSFLTKLPILKQYVMFYRYKEQNKNIGMVLLNGITILITFLGFLTFIRVFYFMLLGMSSRSNDPLAYIYDDEPWEDKISVIWWKEIRWLEYLVYQLEDWKY